MLYPSNGREFNSCAWLKSPEAIVRVYNFNRACIHRWLRQYDEGGFSALKSEILSGAKPLVTGKMDEWLKRVALEKSPLDFGHDTDSMDMLYFGQIVGADIWCHGQRECRQESTLAFGVDLPKVRIPGCGKGRDEWDVEYF